MQNADPDGEITALLIRVGEGDESAHKRLIDRVYSDIHRIAQARVRRMRPNFTLSPTDVANEVYGRLLKSRFFDDPKNRRYFYGAVARAVRNIVFRYEEIRRRQPDGPGRDRTPVENVGATLKPASLNVDLLALRDALEELQHAGPRQYEVVQLRYFAGLTVKETADALGVAVGTVESDFRKARAFLYARMNHGPVHRGREKKPSA